MLRGERITLLLSIAEALQQRDWYEVGLILDTFDIPDIPEWDADQTSYYRARIREQPDHLLIPLAEYLGVPLPTSSGPSEVAAEPLPADDEHLWQAGRFRLFLSHITAHKEFVSDVKSALGTLGVDAFVAHEDIAPTLEWSERSRSPYGHARPSQPSSMRDSIKASGQTKRSASRSPEEYL